MLDGYIISFTTGSVNAHKDGSRLVDKISNKHSTQATCMGKFTILAGSVLFSNLYLNFARKIKNR